jgi:hypothetical protein
VVDWLEGRYKSTWYKDEKVFKRDGIYDYYIDETVGIRWSPHSFWEMDCEKSLPPNEHLQAYQDALLTAVLLGIKHE